MPHKKVIKAGQLKVQKERKRREREKDATLKVATPKVAPPKPPKKPVLGTRIEVGGKVTEIPPKTPVFGETGFKAFAGVTGTTEERLAGQQEEAERQKASRERLERADPTGELRRERIAKEEGIDFEDIRERTVEEKKTRLETGIEQAKKDVEIKKQQSLADQAQRREQIARGESAFQSAFASDRGGVIANVGLGAGIAKGATRKLQALDREIASFEIQQAQIQDRIEEARKAGLSNIVKSESQKLGIIERANLEAQTEFEKQTKGVETKALEIIEFLDNLSASSIAGFDETEISQLFQQAGLPSFASTAFISENAKLAEAEAVLAEDPTNIEAQNRVFALKGQVDKIKSEIAGVTKDPTADIKNINFLKKLEESKSPLLKEFRQLLGLDGEEPFDFSRVSGGSGEFSEARENKPEGGYRTDRHNNPTAFTTDVAKQAGLIEGVDYTKGDAFPKNPNLFTARLLGDPVETAIKVIDNIGFYTAKGVQRWSHTAMSNAQWSILTEDQKIATVKRMYANEGGDGSLVGDTEKDASSFGIFDDLINANVSGFISDQEFKTSISGLSKNQQSQIINEKGRISEAQAPSPEEKRIVTQVMRQLPTKLKDAILEKKERQDEILVDVRAGRGVQEILDELKGFLITNNELLPLAKKLRIKATGTKADLADISAAINLGDPVQAIQIVEEGRLATAGGTKATARTAIETVKKANEIQRLLDDIPADLLGVFDRQIVRIAKFTPQILRGFLPDASEEDLQKIVILEGKLTGLVAPYRLENLGSAVTPTEEAFLKPLMASITDQPGEIRARVNTFKDNVLIGHNSLREAVNLPALSVEQLLDKSLRISLYLDDTDDTRADSNINTDDSNDANIFENSANSDQGDIDFFNNL